MATHRSAHTPSEILFRGWAKVEVGDQANQHPGQLSVGQVGPAKVAEKAGRDLRE